MESLAFLKEVKVSMTLWRSHLSTSISAALGMAIASAI
jgi:deoxyxylulose-5-phosphate synthase